jgi:hypothetical protein
MNTYYSGFGSAEIEAAKSANNLQGSLNKLKNSFTDLVQNVANTDFLTTSVQGVNDLTNGIDFLIEKVGLIPTVLSGVGIGALVKNGGRVKTFTLNNMPPSELFLADRQVFISDFNEIH